MRESAEVEKRKVRGACCCGKVQTWTRLRSGCVQMGKKRDENARTVIL